MKITERKYLNEYSENIGKQIPNLIGNFNFSESKSNFDYLTKASTVYSSNIEGNSIDLNSYWQIPSEEYYKNNQQKYYDTINLGVNFYELNYDKCLPFLEMLPNCLK